MQLKKNSLIFFGILLLAGCQSYKVNAPVSDVDTIQRGKFLYHSVQPGETLYAVAWRYDRDYRELAELNHLQAPYTVHAGQLIQLTGGKKQKAMATPLPTKKTAAFVLQKQKQLSQSKMQPQSPEAKPSQAEQSVFVSRWIWPTESYHVKKGFSGSNKGIDITGNYKDRIFAVASGQVVYADNRIRGYGNLIILKHNAVYLTAYANNAKLLVQTGQWVKTGQVIAFMGLNSAGKGQLHFELRKKGRPANPLLYLHRR